MLSSRRSLSTLRGALALASVPDPVGLGPSRSPATAGPGRSGRRKGLFDPPLDKHVERPGRATAHAALDQGDGGALRRGRVEAPAAKVFTGNPAQAARPWAPG